MGLTRALDISVSAIEAQRIAQELIASNIANIDTTRTVYGGPYRRRIPVFGEKRISFAEELSRAEQKMMGVGGGVEVVDVVEDSSPFQKVYKPGHPDADEQGFVALPNVNLSEELVDQVLASKLYEANITAFNATKGMMQNTLQIQ
jgi:flagellar basal-body rod protein FlgC